MASNDPKSVPRGRRRGQPQEATGLRMDKLNRKQLQALYSITANQMKIDPEFKKIFDDAFEQQWQGEVGRARFWARMEATEWFQNNAKPARDYLFLAANPDSADLLALENDSREKVRQTAMKVGTALDDAAIEELSEASLMGGWGQAGQEFKLERAIAQRAGTGDFTGDIKANADALKALAMANGVEMSENYFESAAKSVVSKGSQMDYWEKQIREQSASKFPVFGEQIRLGVNVADLASGYVRTMAETLELNPATINLNDPTILGALTNFNEQGKPYAMNLGEFKQKLRERPEYMLTDSAQNNVTSIASSVMKMFGLRG